MEVRLLQAMAASKLKNESGETGQETYSQIGGHSPPEPPGNGLRQAIAKSELFPISQLMLLLARLHACMRANRRTRETGQKIGKEWRSDKESHRRLEK